MTDKKKPEIKFVPGCFDGFDGTQEELDEFVAEITRMAESGELEFNSRELTDADFDELPDDIKKLLSDALSDDVTPSTRKLQ